MKVQDLRHNTNITTKSGHAEEFPYKDSRKNGLKGTHLLWVLVLLGQK